MGEGCKRVCVLKHCFCACVRGNTQEGEVKRENDTGRQGCKSKKTRTKERTESWWCCVGALVVE